MQARNALALGVVAMLLGACAADDESAHIVVVVREGARPIGTLDELELEVTVPSRSSDEPLRRSTTRPSYDASGRLQAWTLRVSPASRADVGGVVYRIRATARRSGDVVVAAQARVTFVRGLRLVLPLTLEADCVGIECDRDETCVAGGRCADDFVPACALGADTICMDASIVDSAERDTSEPMDVGPDVAESLDAGPETSVPSDMGFDSFADADDAASDAAEMGPDTGASCEGDALCADDDACTVDRCASGSCVHEPLVCPMGDACTAHYCDPTAGCRSIAVDCAFGSSCVGGECVCDDGRADCDRMAGCEVDTTSDPMACGDCATRCLAPTRSCVMGRCVACALASDCPDDGLACTAPRSCTDGLCSQPLMPGFCLIAGACYPNGAANPANQCQVCNSATPSVWTNRSGGCDDGAFCTRNDFCTSGSCAGTTSGVCFDGVTCTFDFCDEPTDTCSNPVRLTSCRIADVCYAAGDHRPLNGECLVCDPTRSRTDWSPAVGEPCSAGPGWTCSTAGTCCSPSDGDGGPVLCS